MISYIVSFVAEQQSFVRIGRVQKQKLIKALFCHKFLVVLPEYSTSIWCLTCIHVQVGVNGDGVHESMLPKSRSCYQSLRPLSPSVFSTDSVRVHRFEISENGNLVINASWVAPESTYGNVTAYQVRFLRQRTGSGEEVTASVVAHQHTLEVDVSSITSQYTYCYRVKSMHACWLDLTLQSLKASAVCVHMENFILQQLKMVCCLDWM